MYVLLSNSLKFRNNQCIIFSKWALAKTQYTFIKNFLPCHPLELFTKRNQLATFTSIAERNGIVAMRWWFPMYGIDQNDFTFVSMCSSSSSSSIVVYKSDMQIN